MTIDKLVKIIERSIDEEKGFTNTFYRGRLSAFKFILLLIKE